MPGVPVMAARIATLVRWRMRATARAAVHELFRTLPGWAAICILLVAAPSVWHLGGGGAELVRAGLDAQARSGALLLAHFALTLCYATVLSALLLKELVGKRREEPLLAHPGVLPELTIVRIAGAMALISAYLWGFFYLFFHRLLIADSDRPWIILAAHLVSGVLYFTVLGIGVAGGIRRVVRGERGGERARLLQRVLPIPFLISFPLFVLVPTYLHRWAPGGLSVAGAMAPWTLHLLQAPLGVAVAVSSASWGMLAGWMAVLSGTAGWMGLALWRWRLGAMWELPLDLASGGTPRFESALDGLTSPSSRALTPIRTPRLFWTKDITLPLRRSPLDYIARQVTVTFIIVASCGALSYTGWEERMDALSPSLAPSALALALAASLVMARTLNSLGREGRRLGLLRPVIAPSRLYVTKLIVDGGAALVQALAFTILVIVAARTFGLSHEPVVVLLLEVGGATILLSFLGIGLGFLLPDLRRRATLFPGASLPAKVLFSFSASACLGVYLVSRSLLASGEFSFGAFLALLGALVLLLCLVSAGLSAWALHRLRRIEL